MRIRALPAALLVLAAVAGACGDSATGNDPDPPSLVVSSTTVTLTAPVLGDPVSSTVAVTNGGDGSVDGLSVTVTGPASDPADWLEATLDRSSAPATLTLEARPGPLSGTSTATVAVASTTPGAQREIQVSFERTPRPFFYLIDHDTDRLRRMDPATLEITDVGPLGIAFNFGDCAWDPTSRRLFVLDGRASNALYTADLATGAATLIGTHGIRDLFALEIHPETGALFAAGSPFPNRRLFRLDPGTGAATEIGGLEFAVHGLAWDAARQAMVAVRASNASALLTTIDLETAAQTIIDGTVAVDNHGIAYDPVRDLLWAADLTGSVFQFDPSNAYAATVVATGTGTHTCLAYVP